MTETINDLIVLGTAVPEETRSGRVTVCLAGYSPRRGLIRIYPCKPDFGIRRWDILSVELERDPRDNRRESWKFPNSQAESNELRKYFTHVDRIESHQERRIILESQTAPCVHQVNKSHNSLAIIHPAEIRQTYFVRNRQHERDKQGRLVTRELEWAKTKADFEFEPRIDYRCGACRSEHNQKILDWSIYEWMRKEPKRMEEVWKNLLLFSPNHDIFLLVGNQANQRTSFLVISVIAVRRQDVEMTGVRAAEQPPLFDLGAL